MLRRVFMGIAAGLVGSADSAQTSKTDKLKIRTVRLILGPDHEVRGLYREGDRIIADVRYRQVRFPLASDDGRIWKPLEDTESIRR